MSFFKYCATVSCLSLATVSPAHAALTNYHSVMLGDRAGGMGGAFTALTGDSAASAYYNPATLARLEGSSLSTSVSLFNKYDITYGTQDDIDDAVFRINKGSIVTVPSASGFFTSFRNFSAGLSIVIPDYQSFGGDIYSNGDDSTFLRLNDQTLWVGGAFAFNFTETQALGFSAYYTSQNYARSLTNRYDTGTEIVVENEEKTYSSNSFIFLIGHYIELSSNWRIGYSYRFRSIPVSGEGSYLQSEIGTVSGAEPLVQDNNLSVESRTPDKISIGIAYVVPRDLTVSFDVSYYGTNKYSDAATYGDPIEQKQVVNFALGYENYLEPWLALRLGLFTDHSSAPDVPREALSHRYSDHIDNYGFSANFGIHTTEFTTISVGGYYLEGTGHSGEKIGASFARVDKNSRLFSFLVGSSYSF